MIADKITGRTVFVDRKEYIYFGGTSYLNLPYEGQFRGYIKEGMDLFGGGLGSSPITYPRLSIYGKLEGFLANYYGFESALLFSSGRAATQALISLAAKKFKILYGPFAHQSLHIDGSKKDAPTTIWANDFIDPLSLQRVNELPAGEIPTYPKIIDASHAFGVLDEALKTYCRHNAAFACGSLNKGLGIHAGVVLCDRMTKRALQESPVYQSSSNASPALCHALLKAFGEGFISAQQGKVKHLAGMLSNNEMITIQPPFPVGYVKAEGSLYEVLQEKGILLWRGGYSERAAGVMNRLVIHAGHKSEDVERLVEIVSSPK